MEVVDYEKNLDGCLANEEKYSVSYFALLQIYGKKAVLQWCMQEGLIASKYECPKCGNNMKLTMKANLTDGYVWRCRLNEHDVSRSVRKGSWFDSGNLSICVILRLTRNWFGQCMQKYCMAEVKVAEHTSCDWYNFCREVCMTVFLNENERIGGIGKIVEVDESKFGRGKPVKGEWVFGGVERGTNKCFFRVVEDRMKETLLSVITDRVLPGTTIISDCWRSYDCFKDEGFVHLKVNHSLVFKDPVTGAHTNTIVAL